MSKLPFKVELLSEKASRYSTFGLSRYGNDLRHATTRGQPQRTRRNLSSVCHDDETQRVFAERYEKSV